MKKKATADPGLTASATEESYESQEDFKEDFVDSTSIFGGAKKKYHIKKF